MRYLGARVFGCFSLLAFVSFLYGYFFHVPFFTVAGGVFLVAENSMGIWMGMLKPTIPVILAIIGAIVFKPWYVGIFWSVAIFEILNIPYNLQRMFAPESLL